MPAVVHNIRRLATRDHGHTEGFRAGWILARYSAAAFVLRTTDSERRKSKLVAFNNEGRRQLSTTAYITVAYDCGEPRQVTYGNRLTRYQQANSCE